MTVGVWQAPILESLADKRDLRRMLVATVLFLMALPLQATAVWDTLRRPTAPLLACGVNFGLLPIFAWFVASWLPSEMRLGVYVAAATPCTLASASVWTRRAGGNDAVAIVVTILTNLSCFVITPLWMLFYTGESVDSEALRLGPMIVKLGMLVVLPMTLAQLLRRISSTVAQWAIDNRQMLAVAAQVGVLTMVLFGAVRTGMRLRQPSGAELAGDIAGMVVAVLTIHLVMFAVGVRIAKWLGLARSEQIAVGFAGSQKTLMVGLQVALDLGFSILPMVTYHVGQLLTDTIIADRYRAGSKHDPDAP